jgi:predicted negative regulator of RcsB-dependent stress response
MLEAFARACELAPDNWEYALQYAKAYYVLDPPRWAEALERWQALENRPVSTALRELIRLHEAKVLINLGRPDDARAMLARVSDPQLAADKQTLLDELARPVAK